jgi:hypothetical protein
MSETVRHVSDKEFGDLLLKKEAEARAEVEYYRKKIKTVVWIAILLPIASWHWIICLASPTYLVPDEVETKILWRHSRHWFKPETVERIEARRTDYGTVEWMKKYPNGEWSQAFQWKED